MDLFQNGVRQLRSPAKMAATVQLRCYWKQLWSRWAITGSWEPLIYSITTVALVLKDHDNLSYHYPKMADTKLSEMVFSIFRGVKPRLWV
jgi:hypothetical protein